MYSENETVTIVPSNLRDLSEFLDTVSDRRMI